MVGHWASLEVTRRPEGSETDQDGRPVVCRVELNGDGRLAVGRSKLAGRWDVQWSGHGTLEVTMVKDDRH